MKHTACAVLRGLSPVASRVRCRRAYRRRCSPAVVEVPLAGVLLAAILRLGLRVNLFPSAPRGLYRAVTRNPTRGAWMGARVNPEAAALRRAPGNLGPGPYAGVRRDAISRGP